MTDPVTLLEAHRPDVPATSPGERAAARSVLEAAIVAERDRLVPGRPDPFGPADTRSAGSSPRSRARPRRLAALAGAAVVATAVGAATLLWPSATPSALAGWDPALTVMASDDAAAIDAVCREAFGGEAGGAELLHVDQRGATAMATYRGAGWDHSCLIIGDGGRWDSADPPDLVLYSSVAGPAAPVPEDPVPGPVATVRSALAQQEALGVVVALEGEVEPSVAAVAVASGDERLDAKLTDGHFTVFWPTSDWPADDGSASVPDEVVVEALDATGEVVGTATVPLTDLVEAANAAAEARDGEAVDSVVVEADAGATG